ALSLIALALPSIIQGGDWNGVLQLTFAIAFWVALTLGIYRLRTASARCSASAVAASLLVTCFVYWGLRESAIAWAGPLGATDDEIARTMEKYAARDASFDLAHRVLGNGREENCGDLCRILRQHTNIRDVQVKRESELVADLAPMQGDRPHVFVFVIDSLRPDYLGVYQPRVDFTPNLDALARESVVFRNAYTQYAGTTLSEPAIWSGALLLHTHYPRPFEKVNALEKLVRANGYRMLVSYDTVLSQLLSAHDDLVRLDADQPLWNGFEMCSTLQQTTKALDAGAQTKPVFFYAQPMNVHQFARNRQPSPAAANWRVRSGFNNRIAHAVSEVDECLGRFFADLKARGLYDNSIIVITSDHGDATGEFGRSSHSGSIFPEIIRVPLIVRLPEKMRKRFVHDAGRVAALTDITPSLYALLGYKRIQSNAVFGRPLFAETRAELESYRREDLFLASDTRAVYGLLSEDGRFLYVTYDSPARSFLFDLEQDPNAENNIVTDGLKKSYDRRIITHLQAIADFYGYKASLASLVVSPKE
ncbi:MAG: sulfatase-like hydrolase/transferase, partial [Longimicrobiales bacterium]